ncbi:MAG TPA: DUF5915 domain-containing protein, partial [Polyangiales bacterium]|nr:DUF5915 domain-containing protein [Polyangiales bacterium]
IDCWFDSGCMPFAQWGYPHKNRAEFERHYPADFITEAIDQTRGWFYSLMAVNTLLFPNQPAPHPFRNCVVLGHIGDEKGQKLSKSKKNYTDPMLMMEAHGGDAVRWALYTGTVPGQGTRFGDAAVIDALREFVLKIWNVYSFFVTYANIDGWAGPRVDSMAATLSPSAARSKLDQYILAELDHTVSEVCRALDNYQSHIAARAIEAFAESLSNWYVRRSRARFWAEADSTDKASAFETLFTVLVELSKLVAPFVPFLAESLYQNLVARRDSGEPQSVHLARYPSPSPLRANEPLRQAVDTVRDVVALGQRVRAERKLKVRQPLSEAIVAVADGAERDRLQPFADAIREELNVHTVTFTEQPEQYVTFELVPNFRALGPKLGKDMPLVKQLLAKADGGALHAELERAGVIELALPSGPRKLGPEELQVRLSAKADYAAAASHGHVVVLDTRVSDALRREGMAREVVNRVQRVRKGLDLPHEARIRLRYQADGELAASLAEHASYVMAETLAVELTVADGRVAGEKSETEVDGVPLVLWVERV